MHQTVVSRRRFVLASAAGVLSGLGADHLRAGGGETPVTLAVRTVLGPVAPEGLGTTLMHEHAPLVDWSELYETSLAPFDTVREAVLRQTASQLDAFHRTLSKADGPGAIVEATPIRVGRYPQLLVELAKRTRVHIIGSTGFWCEALAPQHPWTVRLGIEKGGVDKIAKLFVREITKGMEDPTGERGENFTSVKAGIIKIGTSTYLRPSERVVHVAAAMASQETGCPITTHTTNGGGLEQARVLIECGAKPEKIVVGHQGHMDDRVNEEAHDYHLRLASLGCCVQFDRVGQGEYAVDKQARQIKRLVDAGFAKQVLLSHDHVPYFYTEFTAAKKRAAAWSLNESGYTVVTTQLVPELLKSGVSQDAVQAMLIETPRRVLAF
jgi:phosphotriesterase-related protein